MTTYHLTRIYDVVEDAPDRIDFHVRSDDYLAYIATLLGYIEDTLSSCSTCEITDGHRQLARELRRDLRHAHANYKVIPRDLSDVRDLRPGRNLLEKPQ